jgi:hypothetical protein
VAVSGITYINEFVKIDQLVQNRKVAQTKQVNKDRKKERKKERKKGRKKDTNKQTYVVHTYKACPSESGTEVGVPWTNGTPV